MIIFTECDCDESWLKKLSDCGFKDDDISFIVDTINDKEWVTLAADASDSRQFSMCLANKFYTNTWFDLLNFLEKGLPPSFNPNELYDPILYFKCSTKFKLLNGNCNFILGFVTRTEKLIWL